jgi:hypothetical protein
VLTVVVWKWLSPYYRTIFTAEHVNVFAAMFRRHFHAEHRLVCVTDDPEGIEVETFPLWKDLDDLQNPSGAVLPSCYRRLKLFDAATTRSMGVEDGERVVSMDLDALILGDITAMFDGEPTDFAAWKGIGSFRPLVYNGSLWMLRAGRLQHMWDEFDPLTSPQETRDAKYFGSDQAWLSFKLAPHNYPGWDVEQGVFSFSRDILTKPFPADPRIIFFNGKRKPWEERTQLMAPWIREHWRR